MARQWWRDGKLPVSARQTETGTTLVEMSVLGSADVGVVYARVSSHDQRADSDWQAARLTGWVTSLNVHAKVAA
jgi:putative resolvase